MDVMAILIFDIQETAILSKAAGRFLEIAWYVTNMGQMCLTLSPEILEVLGNVRLMNLAKGLYAKHGTGMFMVCKMGYRVRRYQNWGPCLMCLFNRGLNLG